MSHFSKIFDFCKRAALPATVVRGALILLVFVVIWIPWFAYNHVPETLIAPAAIEEARHTPDDRLLEELTSYDVGAPPFWQDDRQLVNAAEKLLQGRANLFGFKAGSLEVPLIAASMAEGPTMWLLKLHS